MTTPKELPDRWILGLRDCRVVKVSVRSGSCSIQLTGGAEVVTDAEVQFRDATHTALAHAKAVPSVDSALLVDREVASAVGFKNGVLRIVFRPGYHFVAVPQGDSATHVQQSGVFEWVGDAGGGRFVHSDGAAAPR